MCLIFNKLKAEFLQNISLKCGKHLTKLKLLPQNNFYFILSSLES